MMMKVLALVLIAGVAIAGRAPRAAESTTVYDLFNLAGASQTYTTYIPDLTANGFNNVINSACVTGIWLYYDQTQYNTFTAGSVNWLHGINYCADFPAANTNTFSSLRFSGSPYLLNQNSFTLYDGQFFTGNELEGTVDTPTMTTLNAQASSLIVTGTSPWTFYQGPNYTGAHVCVYPNTQDIAATGERLDLGLYPTITSTGLPDNTIQSVRLGCFAKKMAEKKEPEMVITSKASNGASGYFKM